MLFNAVAINFFVSTFFQNFAHNAIGPFPQTTILEGWDTDGSRLNVKPSICCGVVTKAKTASSSIPAFWAVPSCRLRSFYPRPNSNRLCSSLVKA